MTPARVLETVRALARTWTGWILLVNTIVFLVMSIKSGSLFIPSSEVLLAFGAKDPVGLANGDFWRLVAPNFVHIGLIHFAFNTVGLYVIGPQLEMMLGPRWFGPIYLLSGTMGMIASAVFTISVSAGASAALFGLLGAGYCVESTIVKRVSEITGTRPTRSAYAGMIVANVILGILIPGIDNAAHLGGLVSGFLLTWCMLHIRPNRLVMREPSQAMGVMALLAALSVSGAFLSMSRDFQRWHFVFVADREGISVDAARTLTRAMDFGQGLGELLERRGRVLIFLGETKLGMDDISEAALYPEVEPRLKALVSELRSSGKAMEAWQVRRVMDHVGMAQ